MFKRFLLSGLAVLMVFSIGISSALAAPVQSGQLFISVNPKVVDPLVAGQQDVSVLDFKLVAGDVEDVIVDDLVLYFVPLKGNSQQNAFNQIQLVNKNTGFNLGTSYVANKAALFQDKFVIEKGETMNLIAVIDLAPNTTPGDAFLPCVRSVKGFGSSSANAFKGTFSTPRCGEKFVLAEAGLTISKHIGSPASQLVLPGSDDVEVATFKLAASNDDIVVKDIDLNYLGLGGYDEVKVVHLLDANGNLLSNDGIVDSNGQVSFAYLDIVIPQDDQMILTLVVDLASIAEGADPGDTFFFEVADVEAFDTNNNEIDVTGLGAKSNQMIVGNGFDQ